ncbi:MAG: cytochrome c oxidase subunit II transmembrane domain-containing protein [Bacteroidia bacterium]
MNILSLKKNGMIRPLILLLLFLPVLSQTTLAQDVAAGEKLFQQNCTQCHKLGSKLIGPDLLGVNDRLEEEWLIRFIHNSQEVINSGDEYAQNLFEQYNNVLMPPAPLDDNEIRSVLAYIENETTTRAQATAETADIPGQGEVTSKSDLSSDMLFQFLIAAIILVLLVIFGLTLSILRKVMALNDKKAMMEIDWQTLSPRLLLAFLIIGLCATAYEFIVHGAMTLPVASSEHGVELDLLFNITLGITLLVFLITQVLLFYFTYKYGRTEKNKNKKALFYPENNKLELFWTLVPAVVLFVLIFFGFRTWQEITDSPEKPEVEIEIFAYQFGWQARYPGPDGVLGRSDFRLISVDNPLGLDFEDENAQDDKITSELHLPVDREVLFKFRARDVIHAAFFPHFRAQMYCVPGMPTQFKFRPTVTTEEMRELVENEEFNYELACNQICGAAHFNMRMEIFVDELPEYDTWVGEQSAFYSTYQNSVEDGTASIAPVSVTPIK